VCAGVNDGVVGHAMGRRRMPFLFAGDTGYCPVFQLIGSRYDVGVAAIPIGAYEPRWFMSSQHCDPKEAVQIVDDLQANVALAIHWGTYPLTTETPSRQLAELAAACGADRRLRAVKPGGGVSDIADGSLGIASAFTA